MRRRKQRHVAAAVATLAGGQLAWMVTQGAEPAAALDVGRDIGIVSFCQEVTNSCAQSFRSPGGVTDVAVADDGETVAFITSEALLAIDTDPQASQPQFRRDVYVSGPGGLRLITDEVHPGDGDNRFWTVGSEVDISGDGRHVTWTMQDGQAIIGFYPIAIPVDEALDDADLDTDVFVAALDADGDGVLDGTPGPSLLASVDDAEANLGRNAFQPSISRDGRFIAFAHHLTGQPTPTEVRLVDRDVDADGEFEETGADQASVVVNPGQLAPFSLLGADQPEVAADGGFVTFRAFELLAPSSSGQVRVWRRSDNTTFNATANDFAGGPAFTTRNIWPSISADGTTVAYDFETRFLPQGGGPAVVEHFTKVVRLDTVSGTIRDDDPATPGFEGPYIANQDPTDPDPESAIGDSNQTSFPSLSDDGRYVVFESNSRNLDDSTNPDVAPQIFAVDTLQVDPVDRVPVIVSANDFSGAADAGSGANSVSDSVDNFDSGAGAVSGSGGTVVFASSASNLASFPTITGSPNAFALNWQVDVEPSGPIVFPDTAVGASSAPVDVTFTTDDFGPWQGQSLDVLDGYVDPAVHDYSVVGGCASPTVSFHANDPCVVQVTFAPVEVGNRVGELCLVLTDQFGCSATTTLGGQALVPDGTGPLVRESLTDDDEQIVGGEGSFDPALSANGRYVAFTTDESLDAVDDNLLQDVYVRDRLRGTTTLMSFGPDIDNSGGSESVNPAISGDGRFITFESRANKVNEPTAPEGDGTSLDVFRVDRGAPDPATGDFVPGLQTMALASVGTDGGDFSLFGNARDASISGDGSQVAFTYFGGEGPTNVLIRDFGSGIPDTVWLDDVLPAEVSDLDEPDMSADGRHVAVVGETELGINGEFPVSSDIVYVYDRDVDGDGVLDEPNDPTPGQTQVVQITTGEFTPVGEPQGEPADFRTFGPLEDTDSADPAISGDGSTVAYEFQQSYDFSNAELPMDQRLTPIPTFDDQIIVADRDPVTGLLALSEVVSLAGPGDPNKALFENIAENAGRCLTGGEGCGPSEDPDVSDDGRYVTFATRATNLVARPGESLPGHRFCGDPAPCDVIAVDRDATSNAGGPQHVNEPLAEVLDVEGVGDRQVGRPRISGDGRFIVFDSEAEFHLGYDEVEPGLFEPTDSNGVADVFLREWQPVAVPSAAVVFPNTVLGATSAPQTGTFSTQDFGPAPVLSVELLGADPGDFLINSALNCLPPLPGGPADPVPPVPAHARVNLSDPCAVSVAFRPTAVGARSATLRVTTGHPFSVPEAVAAASQVTEIPLAGSGTVQPIPDQPVPVPGEGGFNSQPTFDLGSQIVTVTSPELAIPVTNSGDSPFEITNVVLDDPNPGDFTIVGTDCIGLLAPGATCTVRVTFTPTAPGERSAALVFTDTAPGGPHQIGLTGRAPTPTLVVNPGVVAPGRTVQVQGSNWAPNQVVTIVTADAFNPSSLFLGSTKITADAFGVIDGRLLFFPRSTTGPRLVIATGTPTTLTAFQPLLVSTATINGVDFVNRG